MAGYFPVGYTPYIPQYPPQQMQSPPQQNTGIIWVQGESGAKAYSVAPGSSVLLMDSEGSTFYIKSADPSGMPTLRVFDFKERTMAPQPQTDLSCYVTREELEERLSALTAKKKGAANNEQSSV